MMLAYILNQSFFFDRIIIVPDGLSNWKLSGAVGFVGNTSKLLQKKGDVIGL